MAMIGGAAAVGLVGLSLALTQPMVRPRDLLEQADLVAEVTVTAVRSHVRLPNGSWQPCVIATVDRRIKGPSAATISVCESDMAGFNPPGPVPGRLYRMHLLRSPLGTYEPFSYAGFTPLERH